MTLSPEVKQALIERAYRKLQPELRRIIEQAVEDGRWNSIDQINFIYIPLKIKWDEVFPVKPRFWVNMKTWRKI